MKTFSDTLRRLRLGRGWSQRELARDSGVDHRQISLYEMASIEPGAEALLKLSDALECTVDFLLRGRAREPGGTSGASARVTLPARPQRPRRPETDAEKI